MPIELKMPALSPTMEEGTLARWLVKEGDNVASGDILAEIETDKATMEFEAVDEGVIARILVAEGTDEVKVGTVIALIAADGEDSSAAAPTPPPAEAKPDVEQPSDQKTEPVQEQKPSETGASALVAAADRNPEAPEVPEGTETVRQTVREALRDAMAEEMRSDDREFVMGEEVAEYQGAYKVTQGLLDEFGPKRVIDTPITEYGFAGVGAGAAAGAEASSPSAAIRAMTVPTFTSSVPSATRILAIVPSSTASNSIVALSVSISARMSPDLTSSPSFTSHLARVPSSIVGDKAGIFNSIGISEPPG